MQTFFSMNIGYYQFLCLIFLIRAEDTFDCTGYEDDSYHPIYDAGDCRHYWHCIYVDTVYMHAVRRVCPSGTEFHATLRQCETSGLVDCTPPKSPHHPRTTSTTQAWKWKYSRLFSRKRWKSTMPNTLTTRKHRIFDLEEPPEIETTTFAMADEETTEKHQVLPLTHAEIAPSLSLEQLSKNLHALALQHRPLKPHPSGNVFQPGQPNNEIETYLTTVRPRRRTRTTTSSSSTTTTSTTPASSTAIDLTSIHLTTQTSLTSESLTTETSGTSMTNLVSSSTTDFVSLTSTATTPTDRLVSNWPNTRISGQIRRKNLTLYILTSEGHKIRQFSLNQTRGILINCNQLRRRLLGRQLRQILLTTTSQSVHMKNESSSHFQLVSKLFFTYLSLFYLLKSI